MTSKAKRAQYTLEFKLEAVRLVKAGQSMAAVAATLGVVEQTLYNWVKADREGKLTGAGTKPVEGIIYPFVLGFTRPPRGCSPFFEQIPRFVGSRQSNHIHAWALIGRTAETFCDGL